MNSYLDTMERLGCAMPNELGVSLILNFLNKDYDLFVQNYNMHNMGKTTSELHAMLKLHEKGILKKAETPAARPKILPPPKRENSAKDYVCHHCKEVGHWRRNWPSYQAELKKRKSVSIASTSGIFIVEFYALPNKTWVYDTGYGTHICNTSQVLRESIKLKHGALSLYVGNGMRAAVEAIISFDLILPSGLIIVLDNCHFAPSITMGVVSISHNKRIKYSLDSSYLWHCRLGYINKKCMDKLQRDGVLQLTRDESLEKCKSCIFRKMARKTMSREGASYFITFTDDFSLYGYVYLMKHKHELTPPYTPQHNGVSKRRNRTLLDMVRSMMNLTTLPKSFWGYALESAVRILNMVTTKKVERTSYEIWHEKAPKLSYLRETMGYYFVARNVEFFENNLMVQEASGIHRPLESCGSDKGLELIQEEDTHPSENTSEEQNKEYELGDLDEPPNYKVALSDPESDKWLEAMNMEMQSMKDNQVWVLVELPPNGQTVGSKWLFKKKTNMDDYVHTFKACLVAKGYT
ncbi:zinc finger, CCHC-type containing protein [Tanacetum coccineum]